MVGIDLTHEPGIPIREVPKLKWIPRRRRGRRLHVSTVHRWCDPGIRGIRLEFVRVGGTRVTSEAALQRFFARLANNPPPTQAAVSGPLSMKGERIEQELNALRL
jgi:hypothetical protein